MSLLHPSRRTVIKTGVWTPPVLVLATAAPAFANSNNTLTVANGGTRVGFVWRDYLGPVFDNFLIQSSTALAPHDLSVTLTVSAPTFDNPRLNYNPASSGDIPRPWVTATPPKTWNPSFTITYPEALAANTSVILTGGFVTAVNDYGGWVAWLSDFVLTVIVSAPGATSVVRNFASPATPA